TVTAHYLAPGKPGPVHVDTTVVKEGKRFTAVQGTLRSTEGRPILALVGTFGDLSRGDGDGSPTRVDGATPDLPTVEECHRIEPREGQPFPPPFATKVEARLHPADAGFAIGVCPSREPR